MDDHSIGCYCGYRCRSRGWNLASQGAFAPWVRYSTVNIFFLPYSYRLPVYQNHSTLPSRQFILNDTSLAATYDANGNRYLFFQDPTGHIRGAVRTDNQWSTSLNLGISSNAKDYTPLAATSSNASSEFDEPLV